MKKVICFFATEKGYTALRHLVENGYKEQLACVVSFKEVNVQACYHRRIEQLCQSAGLPFYLWRDVKDDPRALAEKHGATGAVTISWRYLLPLALNEVLEDDIIIFHDSLLPKYRGFAPTPTAMMCGEEEVGVTALFATERADEGDILLQKSMPVGKEEYIREVIGRQAELYAGMLAEVLDKMQAGALHATAQNEAEASYCLWRGPQDGLIDWACGAREIFDMVRATGYPYPGAFTYLEGRRIYIRRATVCEDIPFALRQPGKLWSLAGGRPMVVCGQGLLQIDEAVDEAGEAVAFTRLRVRLGEG